VYGTDAHADRSVRVVDTFPAASHPPIVYPAALVANGKSIAAKAFLDYLQSPPAQIVWKRSGFALGR